MAMTSNAKQNFILVGVFGLFTVAVMFIRLLMQKIRKRSFGASDYLTIFALICYCAVTAMTVLIFLWGTNVIDPRDRMGKQFTISDIHHREIGSKLALVGRVSLDPKNHHSRFVHANPSRVTMAEPYIERFPGFVSCNFRPSTSYLIQRMLPFPPLLAGRTRSRKLLLAFLFSLGIFLIAVALAPLPIPGHDATRSYQNALKQSEALLAAFLANIITIAGLDSPSTDEDDAPFLSSNTKRRSNGSGFRSLFDREIVVTSNFEMQSQTASPARVRQMFPRHPWTAFQRMSNENLIIRAKGGRDSRESK
ncbi:conserved hypothetical protein [Histoplasma capsulatum G186AR]|uniref:Uncharacterized protein n=1 Tax=Ajellomyces capsulatus (strain G186AR / H82 / ATCC MYA-2454 / RMSCC 2432) TaxID=447093 RepID=C0NEI0_AJECG|nr:uncharacterized protein HCBG_01296 [Histoplasma capsulatum G186AR]EEH09651.1 conserved hypothetical protein [Histoplasma capsulatum G186AR]